MRWWFRPNPLYLKKKIINKIINNKKIFTDYKENMHLLLIL